MTRSTIPDLGEGLLLGELVAGSSREHGEHPLVLGDALGLGLSGDERRHVAGDAEGFHGGLGIGHAGNDSTGAAESVVVSALSTKWAAGATNTPAPATGGCS